MQQPLYQNSSSHVEPFRAAPSDMHYGGEKLASISKQFPKAISRNFQPARIRTLE